MKTQDRRDLSSPRRADLFPISFTLGYVVALLIDQPWAATNAVALPLWALCTVMLGLIWLRHFNVTLKAGQVVAAGAALVLAAWLAPSCKHSHDTEKASGNDDPTIITELPPDTVFYLNDHLGSSVVELDARGNVIRERSYHPYGSVRRSRGRTSPWSYVGNEYDTGSRLAHFHARQLRSRMGGFYSPDPVAVFHPELAIGAPHRLAPYTYSGGDPINLRDPNGETPVGAIIAGAAVFIGVVTVTSFANAPGPETQTHNRLSLGGFISAAAHNSWIAYGALRSFPLSAAVLYAEATQEPRQPTNDPFVEQVRQLSPPGRTFGGPCPPGAMCSGGGVDLKLKYRPGWSDAQRAAAREKTKALSRTNSQTTTATRGKQAASSRYRQQGNTVPNGCDVDHVQDLQLGGADTVQNMRPLDRSVNRSLGSQIHHKTKALPKGTKINKVTISD